MAFICIDPAQINHCQVIWPGKKFFKGLMFAWSKGYFGLGLMW